MYTTSNDAFTILYIVLEVLIALIVVAGNTAVCYVVLHSSVLRNKIMYMFVTSLAMADLSVGVIVIPLAILTKFGLPLNSPKLCIVMLSFIVIPTQISIFNLMAISVERYLAIRHPRIHYMKLTAKRACTIIVFTWIVSVLIGLLPMLGWNDVHEVLLNYTGDHVTPDPDNKNATTPMTSPMETADGSSALATTPSTDNTMLACKFVEVMDEDYLFFNFATCVLPPLIISAILYFIIFLRLTKSPSPSSSPLLALKNPKNNRTNKNSPYLKRKTNFIQSVINNGNKQNEIMDHGKSNHQTSLLIPRKEASTNKKRVESSNGEVLGKEILDTSSIPTVNGLLQHTDSVARLNQQHGFDEKVLRAKLSILANKGKCESNSCPSHNGSKFSKERNTCSSTGSSHLSTPQLIRSRTGTDLSLATKRRLHEARHLKRKKEMRAAAVLGLIVLAFAICWLPINILNTIARFNTVTEIPTYAYDITILLSHANSAVNFILYSWRLKAFRDQLHKVFKRVALFNCVNKN